MSPRPPNWIALVSAVAASVLTVGVLALWLNDVHTDRKQVVIVNASTPLFRGTGDEGGCHGEQAMTLQAGMRLSIRRTRDLKECAALDVVLPDGREGYVVLGVGDVTVEPPLSR